MLSSVFDLESVRRIHLDTERKLDSLRELTGLDQIDFSEASDVEKLTYYFMKEAKKSDDNFHWWMYVVGCHVKRRFKGEWILIHYKNTLFEAFIPAVVNEDDEIWLVGEFCHRYYFKYRRMNGISYNTFYKGVVDRAIMKLKYTQLNKPQDNFIFIENQR